MSIKLYTHDVILCALSCVLLFGVVSIARAASDIYNGHRGQSFNNGWKFNLGDVSGAQSASFNDATWRSLNVPHDWSIELPFDQNVPANQWGTEGYMDGGIGWYRKTFTLPQSYSGNSLFITFDGVYMNSAVYLNGDSIGLMPYGYSTYEFDVTSHVTFGTASNVLAVKVNHQIPSSRWYPGSGIYRNVWLTVLNPVHIAYCGTFVTTPSITAASGSAKVSSEVQNQSTSSHTVTVTAAIADANGAVVATNTSPSAAIPAGGLDTIVQNLTVANPKLWSTTSPNLYTVKTVVSDNGATIDSFVTTMGFRTIRFDANNGFYLNGQNMKIYGFCNHHCTSALGAASFYRGKEWMVEKLIPMGCNAIRTSHNPEDPELYDICDRLGIMVMDEFTDMWDSPKNTYDYARFFPKWAQTDIRNYVRRDRNHPCVIMWSTANEVLSNNMLTNATNLRNWVRNDDTTRPVTWARDNPATPSYQTSIDVFDLDGMNYQETTYDQVHQQYPNRKIFGSENGGTETDFYDIYSHVFVAGAFFWTGFDYQGEATWPDVRAGAGRVSTCGFPKGNYWVHQGQWLTAPMVHVGSHWNWSAGSTQTVTVYSNCDTVQLFLNSTSLGSKPTTNAQGIYHLTWSVPYAAGTLKAVGRKGGATVAADSIKTTGAAAAIALTPDRSRIAGDGEDLSFVTVSVVDVNGLTVPTAANSIDFTCAGAGTIVGVDNGDPANHLSMKASVCPANNGQCLVIVQSNGTTGNAVLAASSSGLTGSSATIACSLATTGIQINNAPSNGQKSAEAIELAARAFHSVTNIQYHLPFSGAAALNVYDARGNLVTLLVKGYQRAGTHLVRWNGKNAAGEKSGAGIYYCTLTTNGSSLTKALVRMSN
ncbi:MAG: glycoside hydrolase family 2 TIM barrel-domain containing protein [Chitinivibrionales bacterium]